MSESLVSCIKKHLEAKERLVLISVVDAKEEGQYFRMLAGKDGFLTECAEGIAQDEVLSKAKEVLESGLCLFMDTAKKTGLETTKESLRLFLEPLLPDGRTTTLFDRLCVAERMSDDMFTVVPVTAPGQRRACRRLAEKWPLPVSVTAKVREKIQEGNFPDSAYELNMGLGQHFVVESWPAASQATEQK